MTHQNGEPNFTTDDIGPNDTIQNNYVVGADGRSRWVSSTLIKGDGARAIHEKQVQQPRSSEGSQFQMHQADLFP